MDIETRKIQFVQKFLELQNEGLITRLEKLLYSRNEDSTEELERMTMNELNRRIDESMSDSKNGKLIKSTDLISEIKEWK